MADMMEWNLSGVRNPGRDECQPVKIESFRQNIRAHRTREYYFMDYNCMLGKIRMERTCKPPCTERQKNDSRMIPPSPPTPTTITTTEMKKKKNNKK